MYKVELINEYKWLVGDDFGGYVIRQIGNVFFFRFLDQCKWSNPLGGFKQYPILVSLNN